MKALIVILLLLTSSVCLSETEINITNGEWEPYLSEYSYHYGLASHIVSKAFEKEGISVNWGFFPWKRAFENAKAGKKWQASAVWWPTEETRADFLISDPVADTSFVFFHLKSHTFDWNTMDDLKGKKVGFTRGYDYGKAFMGAKEKSIFSVETVPTDEQNLRKLLSGRIHVFPNDPVVGYAQIRNNFSAEEVKMFTHHPKHFEKSTLHLIVSKKADKAQKLIDRFNQGLNKLKNSDAWQKMFDDLDNGKYDKQKVVWTP